VTYTDPDSGLEFSSYDEYERERGGFYDDPREEEPDRDDEPEEPRFAVCGDAPLRFDVGQMKIRLTRSDTGALIFEGTAQRDQDRPFSFPLDEPVPLPDDCSTVIEMEWDGGRARLEMPSGVGRSVTHGSMEPPGVFGF
jgi:hypothetical protein